MITSRVFTGVMVALTVFSTSAFAGNITVSNVTPVIDSADIANLNPAGQFDPGGDLGHIWSNRPVHGQSFVTPDVSGLFLNSVTLQNEENTINNNAATFTVRVGGIAGNIFLPLVTETSNNPINYVPNDYITFNFDNPIPLAANTSYAFDWATNGAGFTTWANDNANYADGQGFSSGTGGTPDDNNLTLHNHDRIFHVDITAPAVPEPREAGSIGINFTGRINGDATPDQLRVASGASAGLPAGAPGTTTAWNDLTANVNTGSGVVSADNGATATVEWGATGTWSTTATGNRIVADEDPSADMMDGHIEATGNGQTFATVSGLADNYDSYDVYVYVGDDAGNRNGEISFNGGPIQNFTSKIFDGTFTEGIDYFLFSNVTGDSFTVSVEPQNDNGANRTGIRGIEIIGHVNVIPEPLSAALLGIASLTLIRRRAKNA